MPKLIFVLCLILFPAINCEIVEVVEAVAFVPVVLTTWKFANATQRAWDVLVRCRGTAIDAVEAGCALCEYQQCGFTVGFGGSPDEHGETTLDAMIMDGYTMNVGAVGGLRRIKNAIGVARKVLDNTKHSFLAGDLATEFAKEMGFVEEDLTTPYSQSLYCSWKLNSCQPNFRTMVTPDPCKCCGPYKPLPRCSVPPTSRVKYDFGEDNHDTIGMVVVDCNLRMASGTSSNGARYKIPGRVGDSPIPGAGSYADDAIGAAAATGDGDIMMRFLPSFLAVEEMKRGKTPQSAAEVAINRIRAKFPTFRGAVITLRKDGVFGAACSGMQIFPYSLANPLTGAAKVFYITCKCK